MATIAMHKAASLHQGFPSFRCSIQLSTVERKRFLKVTVSFFFKIYMIFDELIFNPTEGCLAASTI
jgi:hypothetical protein